ncbi:MAG: F0F1 ATP synthase subunit A [Dehalococcoidia bacterium]|nr:F0F1 ATP synthase subunit A [Dehalococcoidia bacterium]
MTGKRATQLALLGVVILLVAGLVTGAIGAAITGRDPLLPTPGIHLAPQLITGEARGETTKEVFSTDFVLTNTILSSLITSVLLVGLFWLGTSRLKVVPGRLQSMLELIVEGLLGFMESVIGAARSRSLLPLIATIFLFVLFNAWLGLIPIYQSFGITRWTDLSLTELSKAHVTDVKGKPTITVEDLKHVVEAREAAAISASGKSEAAVEKEAHKFAETNRIEITDAGTIGKQLVVDGNPVTVEGQRYAGKAAEKIQEAGGKVKTAQAGLSAAFLRPAGTDFNMPLALAIISFFFIEILGLRALGLGYLSKFNFIGSLLRFKLIDAFVRFLELVSELVRLLSFTFRLFGNMAAGEILVLLSAFLVPFVITDIVYGLELFVGLIQAVVFAGLTIVFAAVAVAGHEEEGHTAAPEHKQPEHGGGHS